MKYLILIVVLLFPCSVLAQSYTCTFSKQVGIGVVNGVESKVDSNEKMVLFVDVIHSKIKGNMGESKINIIQNDDYQLYFSENTALATSSIYRLNKMDGIIIQTKNVGPIEPKYGMVYLGKCK